LCILQKSKSKNFSTSFGEKKHRKTRVDWLFFDLESLLRLFQQWEKCKNHRNSCYSCYKASCQVLNQKIVKKIYNSFYIAWSVDSISAF